MVQEGRNNTLNYSKTLKYNKILQKIKCVILKAFIQHDVLHQNPKIIKNALEIICFPHVTKHTQLFTGSITSSFIYHCSTVTLAYM